MKHLLISTLLMLIILSCNEVETTKSYTSKEEVLDLKIHRYKINFQNKDYPILLNEYDFYLMLEKLKLVRNQQEYFSNKVSLLDSAIKFDSSNFLNYSSVIVRNDSCNKVLVNKWVDDIKLNPFFFNKKLNEDTTLNRIDLNCIYYQLLCDSFKIHQDDISGYYVLRK